MRVCPANIRVEVPKDRVGPAHGVLWGPKAEGGFRARTSLSCPTRVFAWPARLLLGHTRVFARHTSVLRYPRRTPIKVTGRCMPDRHACWPRQQGPIPGTRGPLPGTRGPLPGKHACVALQGACEAGQGRPMADEGACLDAARRRVPDAGR